MWTIGLPVEGLDLLSLRSIFEVAVFAQVVCWLLSDFTVWLLVATGDETKLLKTIDEVTAYIFLGLFAYLNLLV